MVKFVILKHEITDKVMHFQNMNNTTDLQHLYYFDFLMQLNYKKEVTDRNSFGQ